MRCTAARMWYWTADPSAANTTNFCTFYNYGYSTRGGAANDGGVAPISSAWRAYKKDPPDAER